MWEDADEHLVVQRAIACEEPLFDTATPCAELIGSPYARGVARVL